MRVYITLGISLGIGLLIGLQRERTESRLGGIRTFPLMSLLGTFCGLLAEQYGAWVIVAGFLALLGTLIISDFLAKQTSDAEHGQTTEIAALLTFGIGAYLVKGDRGIAALAAGVIVVLLHLKEPMHRFVEKMGHRDMKAMVQFVVITLIILPLVPNRSYGPMKVLNPFDIWRMVVLIVAISLAGYVALKLMGPQSGALAGGVLGGLVSSTATTISYARRTKETPQETRLAVFVVHVASTVAYVRILVIVAIIAPGLVAQIALPVAAVLFWMILISATLFIMVRGEKEPVQPPRNPAQLKSAFAFGIIYAVVLLATALVKAHFGSAGLYVVAGTSGLTSMDAITISISRQLANHGVEAVNGWRLLLIASMANLIFKGAASVVLGEKGFALWMGSVTVLALAGAAAITLLWPEAWSIGGTNTSG